MSYSGSRFPSRIYLFVCGLWLLCLTSFEFRALAGSDFRPPAVPLVTSDPYLSIWSEADTLYGDTTRHWTRREHSLVSLIRWMAKSIG